MTELAKGQAAGVRARHRIECVTRLPCRIAINVEAPAVEAGDLIRSGANSDLDAVGTWRILEAADGTQAVRLGSVDAQALDAAACAGASAAISPPTTTG